MARLEYGRKHGRNVKQEAARDSIIPPAGGLNEPSKEALTIVILSRNWRAQPETSLEKTQKCAAKNN
jgi:hypothetical protein